MDVSLVIGLHDWTIAQAWSSALVLLLAQYAVYVLPVAVAVIWLVSTHRPAQRRAVLAGCVAAAVALGVGLVLERTLGRPRPFVQLGIQPLFPHAPDSSFPSDHSLVGVALVGPLLWAMPRAGIPLVGWALLVGLARVAAAVHYPSDILGSAAVGLVVDAVVWRALSRVRVRGLNG